MRILYLPNEYSQQRQREKKRKIYPVLMAMEAQWYRKRGDDVSWGRVMGKYDKIISEPEGLPFLSLPHPDREFTRWWEYQNNGNFKYHPATYIQAADGCWHGKCSFCVENKKDYITREVKDVIDEIYECKKMGFREIFDDSGTFPIGDWLNVFCHYIMGSDMVFSCNMRIHKYIPLDLMKQSGFRMLLFGVESANQQTLDKIQKGVKVEDIIPTIKKASEAGLEPHVAVMFGYPWETDADAERTLRLVHYLLRKGYARTAQASFYVDKNTRSNPDHRRYVKRIYNAAFYPDFWFNQLKTIRNSVDINYIWKGIKSWLVS